MQQVYYCNMDFSNVINCINVYDALSTLASCLQLTPLFISPLQDDNSIILCNTLRFHQIYLGMAHTKNH